MIITVDMRYCEGQDARPEYDALTTLLKSGTVTKMVIEPRGIGGPICDGLKANGYFQVEEKSKL